MSKKTVSRRWTPILAEKPKAWKIQVLPKRLDCIFHVLLGLIGIYLRVRRFNAVFRTII
jgi:hypothetical protein